MDYAESVLNQLGSLPSTPDGTWLAPTNPDGSIGGSQGLFYSTTITANSLPVPDGASTIILLGIGITAIAILERMLRSV